MKTAHPVRRFQSILLPLMLAHVALRSDLRGATAEAPFTRITNGVIATETAMSVSAAWGDFDNDGWLDLFVGNFQTANSLFRSNRDGTFAKLTANPIATELPFHANGVWADYDNGGWLDLLTANLRDAPPNIFLYRGTNDVTHQRMSGAVVGTIATDPNRAAAASWADYDNDGYLDVFVARGALLRDFQDSLYHDDGTGHFTAATNSAVTTALRSCQGAWADYDNDGDPDLLVAHAADRGNSLFRNDRQGQFVEITQASGLTNRNDSVGAAWGDYDNDGDFDLFVINLRMGGPDTTNLFYQNQGNGTFARITAGELANDTGHFVSCAWVDYDNDGWLDLFVTVDPPTIPPATSVKNRLYRNQGNGTFVKATTGSLVTDYARAGGAAWGDYDNDGFLDVFIANGTVYAAQRNGLYRNQGNTNSWLKLKCVGTLSNRSAIGTKIRVKARIAGTERWQTRQISGGEGWLGFNSLEVIIGLGDATVVDLLRLEWPSGVIQEIPSVPVNRTFVMVEPVQVAAVQVPSTAPGTVGLRLTGATSRPLRVVASPDLVHWSALELDQRERDHLGVRDPEALTAPYRFYRVLAP